jgi:O-antigen/teichoic acid export membrane protein
MKNKAYIDTSFNIADYLSSFVIFLITTKLLISKLGTDGYGFYMFFSSLIGTFGLVDLGMGMAVSKYLSQYIHHKEYDKGMEVITQAVIFYLIAGLILSVLVIAFTNELLLIFDFEKKFYKVGETILVVSIVIFLINLFISIGNNVLVALERWQTISVLNIVFKVTGAYFLVQIVESDIAYNEKLVYIFYALLFIGILKLIVYSTAAIKLYPKFRFIKPGQEIKYNMNHFLKWSSLQYGLSLAVGHVDKIIISRLFGMDIMGVYSFVVNAFAYLYGFVASAFKIFYPKLSKIHADKDHMHLSLYLKRLLVGSIVLTLIVSSISVALWSPTVSWYISPDFAEKSFWFFILFAFYLVARGPEIIISYFFNATAKPDALVRNVIVGASATIVGYFIYVPLFDSYGLILAQITGSLSIYIYLLLLLKLNGFNYFSNIR